MKKNYAYFLILFSLAAFTVIIIKFRKPEIKYELMMRQGAMSSSSEWVNAKAAIDALIYRVNANPGDKKSMTALATAYIQESRISGNHAYYDQAALDLLDKVLKNDNNNFEALIGKATVLLSQHHFTDALPVAKKALEVSPHSSSVYGLLTDAYVETGDYKKAIASADKMNGVRPDMRSYSRISYLREIYGDYKGAIEAMKLAVEAGYPGLEQTEWCRQQLGKLYENSGDLTNANLCYDQSIYFRPAFAWAYAGKGRIEKARKNYQKAIEYMKQAQAVQNDFSFQQELTELYRISNQPELAYQSAQKTIELLGGLQGNESEKNHGHYADKELAYACLDAYDYVNAYKHGVIEYNRRPDNIEVNQMMAWIKYKLGKYDEANHYTQIALSTHSKNPILLYQSGLIKIKNGFREEGKSLIGQSLALNPYISPSLRWENHQLLAMQ